MSDRAADPLAALDGARARPRSRIAVGAAVVLFVVAVAVSAVVSFASGGGGPQGEVHVPAVAVDGVGQTAAGVPADASGSGAGAGADTTILVHVLGAVSDPGIVELAPGARVVDAVAAAGGLAGDADAGGVNLARVLVDGEQLVVPKVGEALPPAAAATGGQAGAAASGGGRVSLNQADVAALDTLPRIGPALAQRIIDWREANGPFTDVSQLLEVTGIGDAVYSGLVDLVSL
jgi:competence protein ComEA